MGKLSPQVVGVKYALLLLVLSSAVVQGRDDEREQYHPILQRHRLYQKSPVSFGRHNPFSWEDVEYDRRRDNNVGDEEYANEEDTSTSSSRTTVRTVSSQDYPYWPCTPVSVFDEAGKVDYIGQRCPQQPGLEIYNNIRFAAASPLLLKSSRGNTTSDKDRNQKRPQTDTGSPPAPASQDSSTSTSLFKYPVGSVIDTAFPYAFCSQMPGLPWNLTYEHMRDIEDREGSGGPGQPIPEDCLTLSIFRPADLPEDLSSLISRAALETTHKSGLLPVTLIIDESGPSEEEIRSRHRDPAHDELDELDSEDYDQDEAEDYEGGVPRNVGRQGRLDVNAAAIIARDMEERGTGRIIVMANFVQLDKVRGQQIFKTIRSGLDLLTSTSASAAAAAAARHGRRTDSEGDEYESYGGREEQKLAAATRDTCRTRAAFARLSAQLRASNQASPNPLEWPVFGSARGRSHEAALQQWIRANIHVWGGDPAWLQEVVIMPDGVARWRTTTEPEWQARRRVREEDAAAEQEAFDATEQKMIFNMPM